MDKDLPQADLKIVQVTDCHISAEQGDTYRGLDPRQTLETLLPAIRDWSPDLVLATGDLSEDGSEDSYDWLSRHLLGLGVPVLAIPGNHDDPALMRRYFAATASDVPLVFDTDCWRLVMLNSAVNGEISGRLDERTLGLLDETLRDSTLNKLIALHHQPLNTGSPWIDKYPLLDPDQFWDIVCRARSVQAVCWGHVHQEFETRLNGVKALGSPSSVSNSLPGKAKFTRDPSGPAARWLRLTPAGELETGLLRAQ